MTRKQRDIVFMLCFFIGCIALGLGFADSDGVHRIWCAFIMLGALAAAVICDSPDRTRLP